jgi:signal transduction histidine kinase
MTRQRTLHRHLLAMCTFLVPLGALAWLGHQELGRQAMQTRSAVDREALQFLGSAAAALERSFDEELPLVARESEACLSEHSPAAAVRLLRARGYGSVLDLLLLGEDGRLRYPEASSQKPGLPFHRDSALRTEDSTADTRHLVDLLLTRGRFDDAARHLRTALAEFEQTPAAPTQPRRRVELASNEIPLRFRLATVERKLGCGEAADAAFRRVVDLAKDLRAARIGRLSGPFDADTLCCGLLAELALAESADDTEPRLELLTAIAEGERDHLGEPILQTVAERAAAGVPAAERARSNELLAEVSIHLHARAFAADYDRFLQETVGRKLRAKPERGTAGSDDLRQVITAGNPNALLLLRPAQGQELERAPWVGLRLDLGQMLAAVVEPFVRSNGSFVLAIADVDGQPIVAPPRAPDDYTPPALRTHDMMLTAWPTDVQAYLADSQAAERSSTMLLVGLFVVAAVGALWLWRSVSRESELLDLKVELVSRVSHELKTPLSLISLYGETLGLKRARDADQAAHFGNVIAREAARLTSMIQRILDFSRQQAGTLDYAPKPVDLGEALEDVAETYAPHLESKGAHLETDLPGGIVAAVDRAAFASVIVNLLDNATKYAREQDPDHTLRLELRRTGSTAEVLVLDRGRGIPAAERERVFDSFYRASNAGEVRGAGLGLSLCRHFARAHGGDVQALPRPGGGSIFRLTLPLTETPTPTRNPTTT